MAIQSVFKDVGKPNTLEAVVDYLKKQYPLEEFKRCLNASDLTYTQGQHSVIDHLVALAAEEEE